MFLNCFSYPSEDQEMYDDKRQAQRVHVNSNTEESSQYQTYPEKSEIVASLGKQPYVWKGWKAKEKWRW